jgi:hypothetical protein
MAAGDVIEKRIEGGARFIGGGSPSTASPSRSAAAKRPASKADRCRFHIALAAGDLTGKRNPGGLEAQPASSSFGEFRKVLR